MQSTRPNGGALLPPTRIKKYGPRRWREALPIPDALSQPAYLDRGNAIYVLEQFLTSDECSAWIEYGEEEVGFEPCVQAASRDYAFRKQARISFESKDVAQQIFLRIFSREGKGAPGLLPILDGLTACACSSNIRLYRYQVGDAFGRHIDESNEVTQDDVACVSKFTVLVYLNGTGKDGVISAPAVGATARLSTGADDDLPHLQGGETMFYRSHTAAQPTYTEVPKAGNLLLHRHGQQCLTHEAKAVTAGVKYVLRTDVLYSVAAVSMQDAVASKANGGKKRGR